MGKRPVSAGTVERFRFQFKVRKGFFDVPKVRKTLGEARFRALDKAGFQIHSAAKRGIGQRAPKKTKKWVKTSREGRPVEFVGGLYRDITPYGSGKPRAPGQPVKSWQPKRFLYRDIRYYYDFSRGSVVIGPEKAAWLNQLHEFGGTLRLTAYRINVGAARIAFQRRSKGRAIARGSNGRQALGALLWTHKGFRGSRGWDRTSMTKSARYPARPFMGSASVATALRKVPEAFRDTIRGPG
jgi:hypothetical protein